MLFAVTPTDAGVFAGTAAVLGIVVLLAWALPVTRAVRAQPAEALKGE